MKLKTFLLSACSAMLFAGVASAETLTIATVNNGDMVRQLLHPDHVAVVHGRDCQRLGRSHAGKRHCRAGAQQESSQCHIFLPEDE